MKTILLALLLAVGLAGCATQESIRAKAHETTLHLIFNDGSCSGTIIGPHAILSATHCFVGAKSMLVWDQPVRVLKEISDGNDHTIVIVDRTFSHWAVIGKPASQCDHVFIFGNPGSFTDMYREGYLSGVEYSQGKMFTLWDMPIWFGDSGSGIFNERGELVGVLSFVDGLDDNGIAMTFMGSFPLAFTAEQLGEVARKPRPSR